MCTISFLAALALCRILNALRAKPTLARQLTNGGARCGGGSAGGGGARARAGEARGAAAQRVGQLRALCYHACHAGHPSAAAAIDGV